MPAVRWQLVQRPALSSDDSREDGHIVLLLRLTWVCQDRMVGRQRPCPGQNRCSSKYTDQNFRVDLILLIVWYNSFTIYSGEFCHCPVSLRLPNQVFGSDEFPACLISCSISVEIVIPCYLFLFYPRQWCMLLGDSSVDYGKWDVRFVGL